MKNGSKAICFLFTAAFVWITLTGSVQPLQRSFIRTVDLSCKKNQDVQEEVKYLYVGLEKCATECHNNEKMGYQLNIVKNSPHSNAYRILASEKGLHIARKANIACDPRESAACLRCHITGGGLDSSFFASTYRKEDGVTCEACHKGAFITETYLPKESDCLVCHNDSIHKIARFDFKENCAKIAHPRPKATSGEI